MKSRMIACLIPGLAAVTSMPALAQWSSDASANTSITAIEGDSLQPKVVPTSDGGAWMCWLDNRGGGYGTYVQRLDCHGNALLGANGVLVASSTLSSTQDYGFTVDGQGNAVVAYRDTNPGAQQVTVNKVSPAGALLWGANGVVVSTTSGGNNPKVCVTSDGSTIVGWSLGAGFRLQKLDASGVAQWASDGVVFLPATGMYAVSDIQPSNNGSFVVLWIRYVTNFLGNKHLWTQKFDAAGTAQWNGGTPVIVFDANSIQNGYFPVCVADNAGGAYFTWYETGGSRNVYMQHVTGAGAEDYAHNGVAVSTDTSRIRLSPWLAFNTTTNTVTVAWTDANSLQSQWGLSAQRFSGGVRQWTDTAKELLPLSGDQNSFVRVLPSMAGNYIFCFDKPGSASNVIGFRIDAAGNSVWAGGPVVVCSASASKGRLEARVNAMDVAQVVWHDSRTGNNDIYAQAVNPDGSLGNRPPAEPADIAVFINAWLASLGGGSGGDFDLNTAVEPADIAQFVNAWLARVSSGC